MSDFIPGVYNYCDRWCERCPLTARCRVFADEQRLVQQDRDESEFWAVLERLGCDLPVPELAVETPPTPRNSSRPLKDDLLRAAETYLDFAQAWLRANESRCEAEDADMQALSAGISFTDAWEVISWHHMQILVKLERARSGQKSADRIPPWKENSSSRDLHQSDADGSAKVALIAIERSLGAWTIVRTLEPAMDVTARSAIGQLARLRGDVEARFPEARIFIRPGFDE